MGARQQLSAVSEAEAALGTLAARLREYQGLLRDDNAERPTAQVRAHVERVAEQLRDLAEALREEVR